MDFLNDSSLSIINERYQKDFELFEYIKFSSKDKVYENEQNYQIITNKYKNKPCKTKGCLYVANTDITFIKDKPPDVYGYCCQVCKDMPDSGNHGAFCQKKQIEQI